MTNPALPITVPADLLPGLNRTGAATVTSNGRAVIITDTRDIEGWGAWLSDGSMWEIAGLAVDLTTPTGWDAAVDALARGFWEDMGETERAVFVWDGARWELYRRSWRVGMGEYRTFRDLDLPGRDQPHEALRRVLHHVAGRAA